MSFVVVLVICLVGVSADVGKVKKALYYGPHMPDAALDVYKYAGTWYFYGTTYPCTWKGAVKFTDRRQINVPLSHVAFEVTDTYRFHGRCVTIKAYADTVVGNTFIIRDTIGDVLTGRVVVAAIDYNHYVITAGCVDLSLDGIYCDDGWITLKTRSKNPSPEVVYHIEHYLNTLYNLSISDIGLMQHSSACSTHSVPDPTNSPHLPNLPGPPNLPNLPSPPHIPRSSQSNILPPPRRPQTSNLPRPSNNPYPHNQPYPRLPPLKSLKQGQVTGALYKGT